MDKVKVLGTEIAYYQKNEGDYISLTDMAKKFGDDTMIYSWMRNRNTLEFIGIWEELHNPNFNSNGFVTFKSQAGLNSFNLFAAALPCDPICYRLRSMKKQVEELKIQRPERAKLSEHESLKRMQEFSKRKEKFIATARKGKD